MQLCAGSKSRLTVRATKDAILQQFPLRRGGVGSGFRLELYRKIFMKCRVQSSRCAAIVLFIFLSTFSQ